MQQWPLRFRLLAVVLLLCTFACERKIRDSDIPLWSLTEDLRVGALDGPVTFSGIRDVGLTSSGSFFVFDQHDLRLFAGSGKLARSIARRGAGPGEVAAPNGIVVSPHDTLYVIDPDLNRVLLFDRDGRFTRSFAAVFGAVGWGWTGAVDEHGRLLDPILEADSTTRVRRIAPNGEVLDTIKHMSCRTRIQPRQRFIVIETADRYTSMVIPWQPQPQTVFLPNGTLWCTPTDDYIIVKSPLQSFDTTVVVKRAITPLQISRSERSRLLDLCLSGTSPEGKRCDKASVPQVKPAIYSIAVDYSSRLWVRRLDTPESAPSFDLYDDGGRPLARICAPYSINGIPRARGDTVIGITADTSGVEYVVRLLIRRDLAPPRC